MNQTLEHLRRLTAQYSPPELASALSQGRAPLARAVLAAHTGRLLTAHAAAEALESVPATPLSALPSMPHLAAQHREMGLRLLTAHLLTDGHFGRDGHALSVIHPDPAQRWSAAQDWAAAHQRPLTVAVNSVADLEHAQSLGLDAISAHELWRCLTAASATGLKQLSNLAQGVLCLDAPDQLDIRGLDALQDLLESLRHFGMTVIYSGRTEAAMQGISRVPLMALAAPQYAPVPTHYAQWPSCSAAELATRLSAVTEPTLVVLPSRRSALHLLGLLPDGHATLHTRTLTASHLRSQQYTTEQTPITLTTWGSSLTRHYRRIIHLQAPLPLLAELAYRNVQLTLAHVPEYRAAPALSTALQLTHEYLSGPEPFSAEHLSEYWQLLTRYSQTDSLQIQPSREALNYPLTQQLASRLHRSGVTVLVKMPGTEDHIKRMLLGLTGPYGPHTARITHSSLQKAITSGQVLAAGQGYLWVGTYSRQRGVNMP